MSRITVALSGVCIAAVLGSIAQAKVFESQNHGKPDVKSIDVIGFGPEGTLMIGDGRGAAIYAVATGEIASKIFVTQTPIKHDAPGELHSAETYHVAHGRWETKAPMSVILPYQENGKNYVVGAFACTPVVKYPLDALTPNAKVKGI